MPFFSPQFILKAGAAAATGILLDDYPSAAFAYSFRKLRAAYAGSAVRIRRSSDNAEANIGFSGNDFDSAAAATHISGGTGYIAKWYDQSGHGLDLVNATSSTQTVYHASTILSKPSVFYDDSSSRYILDTVAIDMSSYISTNCTVFAVMRQTGSDAQNTIFDWGNAGSTKFICHATYDDVIYFDLGASDATGRVSIAQPGGWDDTPHIVELYRDSGDTQAIVVDGSSLVTATRTADITTSSQSLFTGNAYFGANATQDVCELVAWGTDLGSTNRTGARTNINTYYSVF